MTHSCYLILRWPKTLYSYRPIDFFFLELLQELKHKYALSSTAYFFQINTFCPLLSSI